MPSLRMLLMLGVMLPINAMAQGSPVAAPPTPTHQRERSLTPAQMAQNMERHLAQLHTQLAITPAQQPQWEEFARQTRENATELHARFHLRGSRLPNMTAAENMVDYAQISELHAQELVKLGASFGLLYATMSEAQKRGADAVFRTGRPPLASPRG